MAELTVVQALNLALARSMVEDERVILLGEDVGVSSGVFRLTDGLFDRFGVTFDHRAVTGGEAARFLQAMIKDLRKPQ